MERVKATECQLTYAANYRKFTKTNMTGN